MDRVPSRTDYGLEIRERGATMVSEVLAELHSGQVGEGTEGKLREAHKVLRSSMNWLEDTSEFETAHQILDLAGNMARRAFPNGCELALDENGYHQRCPVALAHNRVGLSIGAIIREMRCSVCGEHPDDCEHISGRYYDEVHCHRIISRLDLEEVSLVRRPGLPDARIESVGISIKDLVGRLGEFDPGTPITCDRCLSPCPGVSDSFGDHPSN